MFRKILFFIVIIFLIAIAVVAWNIFGPMVSAPKDKHFYVPTGTSYKALESKLVSEGILSGTFFFDKLARQVKLDTNVKVGRYLIKNNSSVLSLVRLLKSGKQDPVKFTITRARTKEDLAGKIGREFQVDSLAAIRFLLDGDTLKSMNVDTNTVMTLIIPNTYNIYWDTDIQDLFSRFKKEKDSFWNEERKAKAKKQGLSYEEVYTMASIIEEETRKPEDKLLIASTYINRVKKGMRLEADPTIKYAMRSFGLTRIYSKYLDYLSPYNTYRNTGLPPGPITTPQISTIDAVLNAPETDYLFFVAKPDFKGGSNFAATYQQHLIYAKAYQKALDSLIISKRQKDSL